VSKSILGMPTFREPCSSLHQGKEQLNTELFLRIIPLLYITLLVRVVEGKKRIVGREWGGVGEIDQSSLTGRIIFHILFILQPLSLFRLLGCFISMASLYFLGKYIVMLAIVIVLSNRCI